MKHKSIAAICTKNATVMYDEIPVLWRISVTIEQQIFMAIVGPNGAGKSTFLQAVLGLIPLAAGTIELLGKSITQARSLVAYVPQRKAIDWTFPVTVLDVVLMGRYGKIGWCRQPRQHDIDCALMALQRVDLVALSQRHIGSLSGGQQQRVFIARALAQDAQLLLLDEPFNGVDQLTEKLIVNLLKELRQEGKTIVVVHHDLHTLADYFDHVLLLNRSCFGYGPTGEIITTHSLAAAFGREPSALIKSL